MVTPFHPSVFRHFRTCALHRAHLNGLSFFRYSVFNGYEPINRPGAITVLVKPNLRWLVGGHDGCSRTFDLPIWLDRLLVLATSLPVASPSQIYGSAPMYPASPIEGHSLQWGYGCLLPISQVGNCAQHQKDSYQGCLPCHVSPVLPRFHMNGSHWLRLLIAPTILEVRSRLKKQPSCFFREHLLLLDCLRSPQGEW